MFIVDNTQTSFGPSPSGFPTSRVFLFSFVFHVDNVSYTFAAGSMSPILVLGCVNRVVLWSVCRSSGCSHQIDVLFMEVPGSSN